MDMIRENRDMIREGRNRIREGRNRTSRHINIIRQTRT